jgi:mannobiose 2-epimerase
MAKNMTHKEFNISAFEKELHKILNWWISHVNEKNATGFIGQIDGTNIKHPDHPRSVILNARILWSFSAAARLGNKEYLEIANKSFLYFSKHFLDHRYGGLYWMVDKGGNKIDGKKQVYAQAFGIYAFTEYYLFTNNDEALEKAISIFDLLEKHARDPIHGGYWEAFSEDWKPIKEVALSEKEGNDTKTMNTHLHILECYTNLYRSLKIEKIKAALENLITLYLDKFIAPENARLKLFFDNEWDENINHDSFGHEIESAWLLNEASEILGNESLIKVTKEIGQKIALRVLKQGYSPQGGIYNERSLLGQYEEIYDWWPQAEAVIGFYDAYQNSGNDAHLKAAQKSWEFINKYIIDHEKGEWYWASDSNGSPIITEDKAGPWKAPYHNSRMCMEMIKRIK